MRPHSFVQYVKKNRLYEEGARSELEAVSTGEIVEAAYLERARPRGLFRWLWARDESLRLRLPFDEEGTDALGLWHEATLLSGKDAPGQDVRRAVGRACALGGGDGPILRDLWVPHETWRVCQGYDFLLETENGPPVVISYGLAPLVITRPRRCSVLEELDQLHPRTLRLIGSRAVDGSGWTVQVAPGDTVEVLGVPRPRSLSARLGALERGGDPYRGHRPPDLVIGDEDGTRLVLKVSSG